MKNKAVKVPTKKTINLAKVNHPTISMKAAVPGIILIILAAFCFSRFFVVDRFRAMYRAQEEVRVMEEKVRNAYDEIASFGDLSEAYAHYTYGGMSQEELNRTDRMEVMMMLERIVYPKAKVGGWTLSGNELNVPITGATLQEINAIVAELEKDPLVSYCYVTNAKTDSAPDTAKVYEDVTGQVTIVLAGNALNGEESEGDGE